MTAEVGPLVRRLKLHRSKVLGGVITYQAPGVALLLTGVGPDRAASAAAAMLRHIQPRAVIITGFAGAADPALRVGDAVRATDLIDGRTGTIHRSPGSAAAHVLYTADHLIDDPAEKRRLHQQHHAAMVDMESAAVAGACGAGNIPWRCLRIISDDAATTLPAGLAGLTHPDGRPNLPAAAIYALCHPHHIPMLLRLGRVSSNCANSLAHHVMQLIHTV